MSDSPMSDNNEDDATIVVTEEVASGEEPTTSGAASAPADEERVAEVAVVEDSGDDVSNDDDGDEDGSDNVGSDEDESAEAESADDGAANGRVSGGRDRRGQLEREGEVAADFLENLLDICDVDGDLDVDIDGDRASVSLVDSDEGRVPRRLVGTQGQVLEALQELTRLAVQSQTGERSRLMLDIAGHRAQRRATLVDVAQGAIGRVKGGSVREALEPMTAFERKVIHDEVLAAGLVSESEGVEPRRFVVILPA